LSLIIYRKGIKIMDPVTAQAIASVIGAGVSLYGAGKAKDDKRKAEEQSEKLLLSQQSQQDQFVTPYLYAGLSQLPGQVQSSKAMQGIQQSMLGIPASQTPTTTLDTGALRQALNDYQKARRRESGHGPLNRKVDQYLKDLDEYESARRMGMEPPLPSWITDTGEVTGINKGAKWDFNKDFLKAPVVKTAEAPASTGEQGKTPWFLDAPKTEGAEWDSLVSAVRSKADINLEKAAEDEAAGMARLNAARGINTSQEQARDLPGFERFYRTAKTEGEADAALAIDSLARGRRDEAKGNLFSVSNLLSGYKIDTPSLAQSGINLAGNQAGFRAGQAQDAQGRYDDAIGSGVSFIGDIVGENRWKKLMDGLNTKPKLNQQETAYNAVDALYGLPSTGPKRWSAYGPWKSSGK
jgi:hypothetical protein